MKGFFTYLIIFTTLSSGFARGRFSDVVFERTTLSFGGGVSYYQGELGPIIPNIKAIRYNAKFAANFRIYKAIYLHYHLAGTVLHGNDFYIKEAVNQNRGAFFVTNVLQGGFHVSFNNFIPLRNKKVIHYAYLGTDVAGIDVKMEKRGGTTPLVPEGNFSRFQWVNPIGFGIGYQLSLRVGVAYEGTFFFCHTDYLDGISQNGNPNTRDSYTSSNLMLTVKLGNLRRRRKPSFMMKGKRRY